MKTAQVTEFGQKPKCVEVENPHTPPPDSDQVQIKVIASGVHVLVRSRAAGQHYSAQGLPHTPGVDGVGTTPDGQLVYFTTMTPKGGSFAEYVNVPKAVVKPLPNGADPIQIAGLLNPGMSSWTALSFRTANLPKDFSVLINGVTSTSGALAISIAKHFGAGKIIGVARNVKKMETLGLDEIIELKEPATDTDFSKAANVDVILDYLYGEPAAHLLASLKPTTPVQYVQIGSIASRKISLPSAILRSKDITLRGAGPGAWKMSEFAAQIPDLIDALVKVKPQPLQTIALKDIEEKWDTKGDRLIVVME
ncbi:Glycogen [starch] synthase [Venturia nashicola]|uniref:Glycogen [starch] synthase n=1 Tax=Venturia nashicola TaxID=86259 RepID=A0A4Z1P399_9PEZI|nr:Glycogen [starch] synthase [Venturia nashicola]